MSQPRLQVARADTTEKALVLLVMMLGHSVKLQVSSTEDTRTIGCGCLQSGSPGTPGIEPAKGPPAPGVCADVHAHEGQHKPCCPYLRPCSRQCYADHHLQASAVPRSELCKRQECNRWVSRVPTSKEVGKPVAPAAAQDDAFTRMIDIGLML